MSSVSEETREKPASLVPLLASIVDGLKKTLEKTTRMLVAERRQRRPGDDEALNALYKVQRKLSSVRNTLEELPTAKAKKKKMSQPLTAYQKRLRLSDDDDDVDEDGGSNKLTKRAKKNETKKAASVSPLVDGGAAASEDDTLVFFSTFNAREGKLFVCPSFDDNGSATVDRKNLRPVDFESLADDRREWYLEQLRADMARRFEANASSLFASSGSVILRTREQLLQNPANASSLIRSFDHASASPLLSAANNAALMLAASLHRELAATRAEGWGELFEASVREMCERCRLTFATVVRWRAAVGGLMLESPLVACMLPYFVAQNEGAIRAMMGDRTKREQLRIVFETRMARETQTRQEQQEEEEILVSFNEADNLALDDIFGF